MTPDAAAERRRGTHLCVMRRGRRNCPTSPWPAGCWVLLHQPYPRRAGFVAPKLLGQRAGVDQAPHL